MATNGDDILEGTTGDDSINGLLGADEFVGSLGNDTLVGGGEPTVGDDYMNWLEISGPVTINFVTGKVTGTGINTTFSQIHASTGTAGNDTFIGSSADEFMAGGAGVDSLTGGAGMDSLFYGFAVAGVSVNLATNVVSGADGADIISGFEGVVGSEFGDTLTGSSGNNWIQGGAGNDTLAGGLGFDTLAMEIDGDQLSGVTVNLGAGTTTGSAGNDVISGFEAIEGTGFADSLIGSTGDNLFIPNMGNDTVIGGGGFDTVSFWAPIQTGTGVNVNLATNIMLDTSRGVDSFAGINGLIGTDFADTLTGNVNANNLDGAAGIDQMTGLDGADTYHVRNVGDTVTESNAAAAGGIDLVLSYLASYTLTANVENGRIMGTGVVNLTGNAINNTLFAGKGSNVLDGGVGTDTVSYLYAASGVTVNLGVATAQATGGSGSDLLKLIENLIGSNFGDRLTGNPAVNTISGGSGNDTLSGGGGADKLNGGGGNDRLVGGAGKDSLTGSAGNDIFDINALSETGTDGTTRDVIADFVRGQDKLDLSTLDANTATAGTNEAFNEFIAGAAAFTAAGQLKLAAGVLYGNTDADATAEFTIQLTGITTLSMTDLIA